MRKWIQLSWLGGNLYALLGCACLLAGIRYRVNYAVEEGAALGNLVILTLLLSWLRRSPRLPSCASQAVCSGLILGLYVLCAPVCCLGGRCGGQLTACKSNLKNLATGLEMYASDHKGHYPRSLGALANGNYLRNIPTCPAAGKDTYSGRYAVASQPDSFTLVCGGCHHHNAGLDAPDYPRYLCEEGLVMPPGAGAR